MKNALKASTILSWFNLIVWGLFAGITVLGALFINPVLLIATLIMGVTVLHSYACLQLLKSIKDPALPLSSQTPVGIRFIGFIALFIGILYFMQGLGVIQNARTLMPSMEAQLPPQFKDIDLYHTIIKLGIFFLVTGASIAINVFLSFRLLRWYLFLRENDIS